MEYDWSKKNPLNDQERVWDATQALSQITTGLPDLVDAEVRRAVEFLGSIARIQITQGIWITPEVTEEECGEVWIEVSFQDYEGVSWIAPVRLDRAIRDEIVDCDTWKAFRAWKGVRDLINSELERAYTRIKERLVRRKAILDAQGLPYDEDFDEDVDL